MKRVFPTFLCVLGAACIVSGQNAVRNWRFGEILGKAETIPWEGNNYEIHKFLGIPFAHPPVDDLRFQKPKPIDYLESPFYATEFNMACVQFSFRNGTPQSEDCLYLNVYVPGIPADSISGHAVAIWIHGGGFVEGTASLYDATFMSLYGNVIVVTINYRLGPYGFLSTGDENAPGNYAFWDQHMAFQWVHDNIGDFGGDNQRVTIFGGSAGAISVSHQGLILQNNGLFQRIIAQSGSAFISDITPDPYEVTESFGSLFGCDTSSTWSLMDCLRRIPNEQILQVMMTNGILGTLFSYVIDNTLIHRDMSRVPFVMDYEYIEEAEFYRSLDVMNGFNSHDGLLMTMFSRMFPTDLIMSRDQMRETLSSFLGFQLGRQMHGSVTEMVIAEYTNWTNPESTEDVREQLVKFLGDFTFGGPGIATARLHAMAKLPGKNYVYYLSANSPFRTFPTPDWVNGANHADEIPFIFGVEMMTSLDPDTSWEIQLSRKMVRYWTNFMKTGDPNSPESVEPSWPMYDLKTQSYIELEEETTEKSVEHYFKAREFNFWYHIFPQINMAMDERSTGHTVCASSSSGTTTPSLAVVLLAAVVFGSNMS